MGSNTEPDPDPTPTPKLPLFSIPPPNHPEPSGTSTPPLQTSASVPFRWEEQPGKPRPCTDLIIHHTNTKCLHLPPRLALVDPIKTSSPSPTTVLDGPGDVVATGKPFFSSSSFRFVKERRRRERRQRSFDSNGSGGGGGWSPVEDDGGGQRLLGGKVDLRDSGKGLFGSFRLRSKGSSVISSSSMTSAGEAGFVKGRKMRRNSSVSKVGGSHFWAKVYEGFKQVVPWRKKPKIESFTL